MSRIKPPKVNRKNKGITARIETVNYDEKPPVFSLERLQNSKYCLQKLDQEGKSAFADAIFRRKDITWREINRSGRHKLGSEKMPIASIKAAKPSFITPDMSDYLVFRYHGKRPMVGYRKNDVFYVLWFDHDFTLYDHS
ncbi:hypothetical protein PE36_15904 [Moritella sp. PE36]|uniref:hypothetical protein n=1 Tax=Moritella sp. PE36 TaxID=58051 RepID=UPI0001568477|nr:hypothetical protein [Moritella sp. PE36]EDM68296.1 hypothetical protein PE36_15904 [Moritella sp. PE36]